MNFRFWFLDFGFQTSRLPLRHLVSLVSLTLAPLTALSSTLSGNVRDKANGQPIEGVTVKASTHKVITTKDGVFFFPNLPSGTHKIMFSRYGYTPQSCEVEPGSEAQELQVELTALPIQFPGITVTGERSEAMPSSRVRIPREEAQTVPGAVRDAFRVLQTLPGVATPTDFAGWLFVRGGDASENLYLLDSGEVLLPFHLLGLESVVSQDALGSLSFSPGGFSVRYGNRLSSVVDIKTREPGEEGAKASLDPLSASGAYEYRLNPANSFLIAGRWNYLDQFLKRADFQGSVVRPHFSDLLAKWSGHAGEHSFSVTELSTRDGMVVTAPLDEEVIAPFQGQVPDTLEVNSQNAGNLAAFSWSYRKSGFAQALSAYLGNSHENFHGNAGINDWHEFRTDRILGAREEVNLSRPPYSNLRLGCEIRGEKVDEDRMRPENYLNFDGGVIALKAKASSSLLSPYAEAEHTFGSLSVQAGGRLDYSTAANAGAFSPRVKVSKTFPAGKLYVAVGRFTQFPSPEHIALGAREPEQARHFILGWEKSEGPRTLRVETYYKPMNHLISYIPAAGFGNRGWGRSSGIELFLRQEREKGFSGWASLAISRSERVNLGDSVLSRFWADQPIIANLVLNYAFSTKTKLGLRFRGSSGPTSTPVLGRTFSDSSYTWDPVYGQSNSERLASYQRLDLRAERKWSVSGVPLTVYGEVLNLTNRQNLQGFFYNRHYSERAPFYMIPRLPFFGLEASW